MGSIQKISHNYSRINAIVSIFTKRAQRLTYFALYTMWMRGVISNYSILHSEFAPKCSAKHHIGVIRALQSVFMLIAHLIEACTYLVKILVESVAIEYLIYKNAAFSFNK